jgi:hypothetical protein
MNLNRSISQHLAPRKAAWLLARGRLGSQKCTRPNKLGNALGQSIAGALRPSAGVFAGEKLPNYGQSGDSSNSSLFAGARLNSYNGDAGASGGESDDSANFTPPALRDDYTNEQLKAAGIKYSPGLRFIIQPEPLDGYSSNGSNYPLPTYAQKRALSFGFGPVNTSLAALLADGIDIAEAVGGGPSTFADSIRPNYYTSTQEPASGFNLLTRAHGLLQLGGGILGAGISGSAIVVGTAAAPETLGAGLLLAGAGYVGFGASADQASAGLQTLITGKYTRTLTGQAIEYVTGASPEASEFGAGLLTLSPAVAEAGLLNQSTKAFSAYNASTRAYNTAFDAELAALANAEKAASTPFIQLGSSGQKIILTNEYAESQNLLIHSKGGLETGQFLGATLDEAEAAVAALIKNGFPSKGNNLNVYEHILGDGADSAFRGATFNTHVAARFATGPGGYGVVFELGEVQGYNASQIVNNAPRLLGSDYVSFANSKLALRADELEVVIPNSISLQNATKARIFYRDPTNDLAIPKFIKSIKLK